MATLQYTFTVLAPFIDICVLLVCVYQILRFLSVVITCVPLSGKTKTGKFKKFITKFVLLRTQIFARIKGGEVVYLNDYADKLYITIAYKTNTEDLDAFTYFDSKVGPLILLPNGRVKSKNLTYGYVSNWLPFDKYKRLEMILQRGAIAFNI